MSITITLHQDQDGDTGSVRDYSSTLSRDATWTKILEEVIWLLKGMTYVLPETEDIMQAVEDLTERWIDEELCKPSTKDGTLSTRLESLVVDGDVTIKGNLKVDRDFKVDKTTHKGCPVIQLTSEQHEAAMDAIGYPKIHEAFEKNLEEFARMEDMELVKILKEMQGRPII